MTTCESLRVAVTSVFESINRFSKLSLYVSMTTKLKQRELWMPFILILTEILFVIENGFYVTKDEFISTAILN